MPPQTVHVACWGGPLDGAEMLASGNVVAMPEHGGEYLLTTKVTRDTTRQEWLWWQRA